MGLLSRSGLGYATLDHIWSVSCRTQSDVLSRSELCAALGLVGLAQVSQLTNALITVQNHFTNQKILFRYEISNEPTLLSRKTMNDV